ncbi:MAG: TonB family protein [Sphingomonadales bacterium]|nr:TonB family protein [Sphingomonadales bacterium]
MTYLERPSSTSRSKVIIVVAAIHAVGIYGVIHGLGGILVHHQDEVRFAASSTPIDKPVAVDPVKPKSRDPIIRPPLDPFPLPVDLAPKDGPVIDFGPMQPFDPGPPVDGPTTVQPAFTPKAAAPLGNPEAWASEADYPPGDLHAGHAGVTRFRVTVGSDGRVGDCVILSSSGWPGLDAATCRAVAQRARFRAATDERGQTTTGTFASAIRWVIPN